MKNQIIAKQSKEKKRMSKVFKNIDIRKYGSKNPGATNVYRTISKPLGVLTLILDVLKGFIPVYFVLKTESPQYAIKA